MTHRQMYSIARLVRQTAVQNRMPATVRYSSNAREPPPPNNVLRFVEDYWDIISNYVREPGFFSFSSTTSKLAIRDTAFMQKLLSTVISEDTASPVKGDLMPSVVVKSCCELYEGLDQEEKIKFFEILVRDFGVDRKQTVAAAENYLKLASSAKASESQLWRTELALKHTLDPLHSKFFDRVNQLPGGMKFLIDMRADLLQTIGSFKHKQDSIGHLMALDASIKATLQNWLFGFLKLERITWQSPAVVLEKIGQYEAVHAVKDWKDMKRRVGPRRRVFGFFFSNMPTEPLVFVQVALVDSISTSIQRILTEEDLSIHQDAQKISCATFYSITTQRGLSGINLGNFLIKRVVRDLKKEFPQIKTFATLSPIPGFRGWLRHQVQVNEHVRKELESISTVGSIQEIVDTNDWIHDDAKSSAIKPVLMRLCAEYLLTERRGNVALDPVANFHLRNGACAHQLNWMADTSDKGIAESFSIMVNYNYLLDHIEENNEEYLAKGIITVSSACNGDDNQWLRERVGDNVRLVEN
ncbi:malonyl-CoA decarboxylase-domain-containing protein [Umbelopsis sp. AD052]|nr:malonyl-CoA decarboxylase-domain-containing protein [Umbelopsis sp. AD052]